MNKTELGPLLKNIDLLVLCEEAVVNFYHACAEAWPQERPFWNDLASDELAHLSRLQLIRSRARDSSNTARSIRVFRPVVMTAFIAWVEKSRVRVQSAEVSHRKALAIARDVERSPIVNDRYTVTRRTDPALANYLLSFATEYDDHMQRIEERLGGPAPMTRVA